MEWSTVSYKKERSAKQSSMPANTTTFKPTVTRSINQPVKKFVKNTNHAHTDASHVERKVDDGDFTLPTITRNFKVQMQQARQQKNMTIKQLAVASNLLESIVRSYENGTCIPNQTEINQMSRVLGTQLKNK